MRWILVPFSRPERAQDVEAAWRAQTVECRLVICANGGHRYDAAATHVVTLQERDHVAALNAGLAWIREYAEPEDWVARWDDDDHYAPDYCQRVASLGSGVEWSGYHSVYAQTDRGLWRIDGDPASPSALGGTLAARARSFADLTRPPANRPWEDDVLWCRSMARLSFEHRGPDGFIWERRGSDHIYPVGPQELTWMRAGRVFDAATNEPIPAEDPFASPFIKQLRGQHHG